MAKVVMKFKCNGSEWTIKVVDEATINNEMKRDGTLGVTNYTTQEILLLENQANIIKTLKHELTHVWLYEYGHAQDDNTTYGYEDICEIVASSNDFVNKMVNSFKNSKISSKTNDINKSLEDKIITEAVRQCMMK